MKKVKEDLQKARQLLEDRKRFFSNFERFDRIYPFTNENIKESLLPYNLENTNCLTVLASSDQTLDMCLKGANNITAFDVNTMTEYYFYLKRAALLTGISLEEYLQFFCYLTNKTTELNEQTFNLATFTKIAQNLPHDSYIFWSTLFDEYSPQEIRTGNGIFVPTSAEFRKDVLQKTITYLNNDDFNLLKEKIKDLHFQFIHSDIKDLPKKLTQNYDFIYLSNIIQYTDEMYKNISNDKRENQLYKLNQFKELIYQLSKFLNQNGNIMAGYIYNYQRPANNRAIFNKYYRDQIYNSQEFHYYLFKAVSQLNFLIPMNDASLVYTKK